MKRLIVVAVLIMTVASVLPAGGTDSGSCSATAPVVASAVTVSGLTVPLVTSSAPICTFEMFCPASEFSNCAYTVWLDVTGTGMVSGTFAVEKITSTFVAIVRPGEFNRSQVSCSGVFGCHLETADSDFVLITGPGRFQVRCTGDGLAAFETASCETSNIYHDH